MADDEGRWTVRVRWLAWRPSWRRSWREWQTDALVPLELLRRWRLAEPIAVTIGLVLSLVVLLLGVVVAAAAALAAAGAALASLVEHLALRRPFPIEATRPSSDWHGWWVAGWLRARRVRARVEAQLVAGRPVDLSGERGVRLS
jgi:hypothetical protein